MTSANSKAEAETLMASITSALSTIGDSDRATQQQAYMKSALPYFGVTTPIMRKTLTPILLEHFPTDATTWRHTIRHLWDHATHREHWYAALSLARHRKARAWRTPDALPTWRHLITTGAWWDVVDDTASHLIGDLYRTYPDDVADTLREWMTDDHMWLRRTAIICQIGSKGATDTDFLEQAIAENLQDSLYGNEFFIRKAIGWALREYAKTDTAWVIDRVDTYGENLSGLSRREALKHLRKQ